MLYAWLGQIGNDPHTKVITGWVDMINTQARPLNTRSPLGKSIHPPANSAINPQHKRAVPQLLIHQQLSCLLLTRDWRDVFNSNVAFSEEKKTHKWMFTDNSHWLHSLTQHLTTSLTVHLWCGVIERKCYKNGGFFFFFFLRSIHPLLLSHSEPKHTPTQLRQAP